MANSEQPRPKKAGARVYFEDEAWAEGFTQIPNRLITMPGLDPDTKMVLITIMCHGWKQQDLPDQAEMAPGLNRSPRWLWGQIQELAARNIIIINRTGLNEANSYTVRRMSEWNLDSQGCANPPDSQGCANQTRNRLRILKSHTPAKQESQGAAKPSIQDVSKTTTKTDKTGGTEGADAPRADKPRTPSLKQTEPEIWQAREAIKARYLALNDMSWSEMPRRRRAYADGDAEALARKCAERGDALAALQAVWDEQWSNGTYPNRDYRLLQRTLDKVPAFRRGELTRKPNGKRGPLRMNQGTSAEVERSWSDRLPECGACGWDEGYNPACPTCRALAATQERDL